MKKLSVFLTTLVIMFFLSSEVSAQPPWAKAYGKRNKEWKEDRKHRDKHFVQQRRAYYYYPASNVYYSPVYHNYWYPRNGAWVNVNVLPRNIVVVNEPRYDVYYDGDDVWRDNRVHYERYRPVPKPGVSVDIHARF